MWYLVQQGVLEIMYCITKEQVANIFMKVLPKDKFYKFKDDDEISQMIIIGEKCWMNDSFVLSLL